MLCVEPLFPANISTLLWVDMTSATSDNVKSTLKQRFAYQPRIYSVEQRRISVFLFQRKYEQLQTSDFVTLSSVEKTWMLPFPKNMTLKFVAKNEIISLGIKKIFEIEYTTEGNLQGARKEIKEFEQFKDALIQKIILKCILDQTIRNCQTLFQWSREKCF